MLICKGGKVSRMKAVKTVLIVDDHPIVANSMKKLINDIDDVEVIGVVGDGKSCIQFVDVRQPDIIILDYQLPDLVGTQVVENIKMKYPQIHIIIFTGKEIEDFVQRLLELEVSGIVSKESDESTIKTMIASILSNHTLLPLSLFHQMRLNVTSPFADFLTFEEVRIMTFVAQGLTNEEIAEKIFVSKRSVDNYLRKIYNKLEVRTRSQAVQRFADMQHQRRYP